MHIVQTLFGKGIELSDLWLPVRLSGDLAVFRGINKHLLEAEARNPGTVLDQKFIAEHTVKFDEFKARVEATFMG